MFETSERDDATKRRSTRRGSPPCPCGFTPQRAPATHADHRGHVQVNDRPIILSIDIGGSHVKFRTSERDEPSRFASSPELGPDALCATIRDATRGWRYDGVSIGYPGVVVENAIVNEPHNLGAGWVGFDFAAALGRPTRLLNDAAMQALGDYRGGTMLFLGLGTGLGSAMIAAPRILPTELAHLPYRKGRSFEDYLGERGRRRRGRKKWEKHVWRVVDLLRRALQPSELVIGGGNAEHLERVPGDVRIAANARAFEGGFRLWRDPWKAAAQLVGEGD